MRESFGEVAFCSIEKRGTALPHGAMDCTNKHAVIARALWPKKTAENWAAAAGVKARMAKYWLSRGKVSDSGKLALIREID